MGVWEGLEIMDDNMRDGDILVEKFEGVYSLILE